MARPTKRNPIVEEHILRALAEGNARWPAAALAGISGTSLSRWMAEDEDFALRVQQAEAMAIQDHLEVIKQAADSGTWQAAAWWLERRHPDQWGRNRRPDEMLDKPEVVVLRWADDPDEGVRPSTRP
jgi:hypothetical protein